MSKLSTSILASAQLVKAVYGRKENGRLETSSFVLPQGNAVLTQSNGAVVLSEDVTKRANELLSGFDLQAGYESCVRSLTDALRVSIVDTLKANTLEYVNALLEAAILVAPTFGSKMKKYLAVAGFTLDRNTVVGLCLTEKSVMEVVSNKALNIDNVRIKSSAEKSAPLTLGEVVSKKSESISKQLEKVTATLGDSKKFKPEYVEELKAEQSALALEVRRASVASKVAEIEDTELLSKIEELIALHA